MKLKIGVSLSVLCVLVLWSTAAFAQSPSTQSKIDTGDTAWM